MRSLTDFDHFRLAGPEDESPYRPYGNEYFFGGDEVEHWRYYIGHDGRETAVYITGPKDNHEHNARVAATVRTAGLTGHTLERAVSILEDLLRSTEGDDAYVPQEIKDEIDELLVVAGVVLGLQRGSDDDGDCNDD